MADLKEVKAGDPCPLCGGEFRVVREQTPDALADRLRRNNPDHHLTAARVRVAEDKAAEFGLIHRCGSCGYQSRFHPAKGKKAAA